VWLVGRRTVGVATALGGVLALGAAVPTRWFGPVPNDSYVFDPPRFSALWIERAVVPVAVLVAVVLMLAGLVSLFRRDRERMPRWQRWTAVVALIGAAVGTFATTILVTADGGTADPSTTLNTLLGAALALLAFVLLAPGLLAWGVGYLRSDRPLLGAALTGGPILPVLIAVAIGVLGVDAGVVGALPVVVPVSLGTVLVGRDLWRRSA
jgi:hypothetical protein